MATTIEDLADDYTVGTMIRFRADYSARAKLGRILGYCYTVPENPLGKRRAALVVQSMTGIGHVLPHQVTAHDLSNAALHIPPP